jgi:PadR family transcriptional regulator, regulatory protein PadR
MWPCWALNWRVLIDHCAEESSDLERGGLLKSVLRSVGGRKRQVYKITPVGKKALDKAREKVDELHYELHEQHPRKVSPLSDSPAAS